MGQDGDHDPWVAKKKVWMWFPEVGAKTLRLSDILVYCYRAYQDEYDETPSNLKVCKATGLSKQAIINADQRLIAAGLLETDRRAKEPPPGWFQIKRPETLKGMMPRHWRHRHTHWDMLIRNPKTAHHVLTHLQAAVVSFLWHCRRTNFEPREGWSISYLSTVLHCKWDTAREALDRLTAIGMLDYHLPKKERLQLTLCKPIEVHLGLFQDAQEPRQSVSFRQA